MFNLAEFNGYESQAETGFQAAWEERCLRDNGISPKVYAANIRFIEGQDVFESLGWDIPKQRGSGGLRHWNEAAAFVGEDGEAWQLRLDVARVSKDGKVLKYESPKGGGAQLYFPVVPIETRLLISAKWGVNVPEMGSFWAWFNSSKEARGIPVLPTEGGTKALALLSAGYPSVSLYGCSSAWSKRDSKYDKKVLMPQLREVCRGRSVYFAFDSDIKPNAVATVRSAIALIGKTLHKKISPDVRVLEWEPALGKGVDDMIAAQGLVLFEQLFDKAAQFSDWKKASSRAWAKMTHSLYSGGAKADFVATAPTVTDCNFDAPKLGTCLLLDAGMGLGKTYYFGVIIKALRELFPDLLVDAIGHRNNLLIQTGRRLGLTHIRDTATGQHTGARIAHEESMAFCADSLWRRFDSLIRAMDAGQKVLLILDEVDALIKHILLSGTIGSAKRIDLIRKFSILLKQIAAGNGWIIGGEAHLTELAAQSLRDLSGGALIVKVAANKIKPAPWDCLSISGVRDGAMGSKVQVSAKQTTLSTVSKLLARGQKVALLTTSQAAAEEFDIHFSGDGLKVWRLDSKTSAEPENCGCFENLGEELRKREFDLFIATPTIESGVSIEGAGLVDAIVLYSSGLEPASSYQMLGRFRDSNIPRIIIAAESGQLSGARSFDPGNVLQQWRDRIGTAMASHGLMGELDPILTVAHEIAAKYLARECAGVSMLREVLLEKLAEDGHSIQHEERSISGAISQLVKNATKAMETRRGDDWVGSDDSDLTPESARLKMRESGLTWLDRVGCLKAIARGKYGDLVDQRSWVDAYWADERDGRALENATRTAAEFSKEGMAGDSDRRALQRQLKATGTVWGASFQGRDRVIQLLKRLNLENLLLHVGSVPVHRDHPAVKAVFKSALLLADEVSDVLNLNITPESNPLAFVKDLLGSRLGYKFQAEKVTVQIPLEDSSDSIIVYEKPRDIKCMRFSWTIKSDLENPPQSETLSPPKRGRGRPKKEDALTVPGFETVRIQVYHVLPCPHHAEMMQAFQGQHEAAAAADLQVVEDAPATPIALNPGRSVVWGGELWTVVAARGSEVWLCEGGTVKPLNRCLKTSLEMLG
jgi:hypothetical protein